MEFAPKPRLFALSCSSIFRIRTEKFVLAGPLGFEPRQSAPKALDLPLVDGPVKRSDWLTISDSVDCTLIGHHSIVNQQSKISNQEFFSQYFWRVNVPVATAFSPCFRRRLTAFAASARDRNNPYRVDPDPESEAYLDPARSSAPFMSRNSGYRGKTTFSKSFSIPVRTRSRSKFPARLPPFAGAPVLGKPLSQADNTRLTSISLSDAPSRVNSSLPMERRASPSVQTRVRTAALFGWGPVVWGRTLSSVQAERSSAAFSRWTSPSQSA